MQPSYTHALDSIQVLQFLEKHGISIDQENSSYNKIVLTDQEGDSCCLWAEVGGDLGIPGIFVDFQEEDVLYDREGTASFL